MPRTSRANPSPLRRSSSSSRRSRGRNDNDGDALNGNRPTTARTENTPEANSRRILFPDISALTPTTNTNNTTTAAQSTPNSRNPSNPNNPNEDEVTVNNNTPPSNSRRTQSQSLYSIARGTTELPQPRMRMSVTEMRAVTHQIMDTLMRKNTRDAYKYRILEFRGFCASIYYFQPECTRYTVTGEKLYQFMFYQVFRDQKTSHKHPGVFDELDYDRLGEKYLAILDDNDGTIIGHETEILEALEPRNPLGFSSVSTYRSAVRKLYDYQAEEGNGSNSLHWDTQICTRSVKNLLKIVQVSTTNLKRIWQYKSNQ